ncbi:hypothetical protein WR25_11589 [Diploscapter pachys]|uniref:Uncharacterized protein n=1 Tax=Diploscapter pachys TaxID=2018661 RepID=A0A2A2KRI7_9BILA|nr:hypothetical protein WR25_11589 [Diploscapter pachys]
MKIANSLSTVTNTDGASDRPKWPGGGLELLLLLCCCTEKQTDCATSLLSPLSISRLPVLFPAAPERTTDLSLCSRLPRPCILPLGLGLCLSSLHSMQIFMFVADSQGRERTKALKQKVRVLQMKDSLTQWLKEDAANQATIKGFRCRNRNRN